MGSHQGININRAFTPNGYPPLNLRPFGYCRGVSENPRTLGKPCQAGAKPNGYCVYHQGQAPGKLDRNT